MRIVSRLPTVPLLERATFAERSRTRTHPYEIMYAR